MASSNRHWPSMFKSKPCNHHSSLLSNSCARSSDNSPFSSGCEERSTPEPKPRWNPKPEQIRILEAIFNSGVVNPPRDEIRRIRAQLQEYGQVGDANVFYWFQNRKSRSKNKQRTLQSKSTVTATATATTLSSSSSSSDKNNNSPNNSTNNRIKIGNNKNKNNNNNLVGGEQFGNSPTSVNQCNENNYFHQISTPNNHFNNNNNNNGNNININNNNTHDFISHEPVFFPLHQSGVSVVGNNFSQGLCFANNNMMSGGDPIHVSASSDQTVGGFSSLLFGDMFNGSGLGGGGGGGELKRDEVEKLKFQHELSFLVSTPSATNTCTLSSPSPVVSTPTTSTAISSNLGQILGEVGGMVGKSTVFINGMAIEVPCAPFNVKEEFGEDVMLVNASTGHPVMTNEWGVTLHALQHGASYYLVSAQVVASPLIDKLHSTSDLLASEFPYQI